MAFTTSHSLKKKVPNKFPLPKGGGYAMFRFLCGYERLRKKSECFLGFGEIFGISMIRIHLCTTRLLTPESEIGGWLQK